jgi:two-component system LytT family response regulator
MPIRTLIIDDEPLARQRIRSLLTSENDVEIVGESAGDNAALETIRQLAPDLVFLDVQMPEKDGFSILKSMPAENRPLVIFVTAFEGHAVAAFEACALDYLLKPFKPARFRQALAKARERLKTSEAKTSGTRPPSGHLQRIIIRHAERMLIVKTEEIDWIESASNYVVLHCGASTHIARETLNSLEENLSPEQFLRISRFSIVNINRLRELKQSPDGDYTVSIGNGVDLPITRGIREVLDRLEFS